MLHALGFLALMLHALGLLALVFHAFSLLALLLAGCSLGLAVVALLVGRLVTLLAVHFLVLAAFLLYLRC